MKAGPAHPHAMAPTRPGRTRTAPPQRPGSWAGSKRMRNYTLFGWTGVIYLLIGLVTLRIVWALGEGPERWSAMQTQLANPFYVGFHVLALVSVIFVAVRFFSLFPKAQPPKIGPAKPPPAPVIVAGLYGAWIGVTVALSLVLAGVIL